MSAVDANRRRVAPDLAATRLRFWRAARHGGRRAHIASVPEGRILRQLEHARTFASTINGGPASRGRVARMSQLRA